MEYSLTRQFPWRWFTPVALTGAVLNIILLSILNVALTGYETITVFQNNFNVTQSFWYDSFMPYRVSKPGTLCDPHVFNVGDKLTTNYTLFEWQIETIIKPNAGNSAVSYQGAVLDDCDVSSIFITGDVRVWTMDFTILTRCMGHGLYEVNAKTSFTISSLSGRHSPLLGVARTQRGPGTGDPRAVVLDLLTQSATKDVGFRIYGALLRSNFTTPVSMSIAIDFQPCPIIVGTSAPCATSKPEYNISFAETIYSDASLRQYSMFRPPGPGNMDVLDGETREAVSNLIQVLYAAARIDLGNPSPNNFIVHPEMTDEILYRELSASTYNPVTQPTLYEAWANPTSDLTEFLPISMAGPAEIQVVYPYRFQRRKSPGQLLVSVLVATTSMFSAGWAVFIGVASFFAKMDRSANQCSGHDDEERRYLRHGLHSAYKPIGLSDYPYHHD